MSTVPSEPPAPADVVVVGGGASGAAVAALLSLRGFRVCLLERESSAAPAGAEALYPGVQPLLAELGLRDRMAGIGAVRSRYAVFDRGNGAEPSRSDLAESGPFGFGYHVHYRAFSELLLDRARELGATVRRGVTVLGPVCADGAVAGVRSRGSEEVVTEWAAAIVVDASGPERAVAGHLAATEPDPGGQLLSTEPVARAESAEPPDPHSFVIARLPHEAGWSWSIPLGQGNVEHGTLLPVPTDGQTPESTGSGAVRRWRGYRAAELAGTGWLSVGDAAGLADPLFLTPSTIALLAAQAAADAVEAALAEGRRTVADGYQKSYEEILAGARQFAAFWLAPERREEDEVALARSLTALLNASDGAATFAWMRGALDGTHPLLDAQSPQGPLVASLAMPRRSTSSFCSAAKRQSFT
ncbi:hypothetical protein CFN78_13390 [Amycolatopsis antarctica]|uniref:FAD dependent oxidoreductase domain-containing protein n=1 Tax=Amycolatopsis antarctica TaxID=1854586 RepID=A0A263D4T9_9PSEU|nr:FAD-dependent oxidoreductase [Amycolatopsis antarctica]OZM72627.1 hypothetical protein CFN78_13390 [Amycolatopsis antarctica]